MHLIQASHLRSWAAPGSRLAQSEVPKLIRDLVIAAIPPGNLQRCYFPYGDQVRLPGVDGLTSCTKGNLYVPDGLAIWEIGVSQDYENKFKDDYKKRVTNEVDKRGNRVIPGKRKEITFVFVTPHEWTNKVGFIADMQKEGIWKDVKIIDAVELVPWLETAPAVAIPLASALGLIPRQGVYTLNSAWDEWSQYSDPVTSEQLVTAGRTEEMKQIAEYLSGQPSIITIRSDSARESWGFALAAIRQRENELKESPYRPRLVVVDDEDVAAQFAHYENLIVILKKVSSQVSATISGGVRHVIICEGNKNNPGKSVVKLGRPDPSQFREALIGVGVDEEDAFKKARNCGLSVTIFQRLNASVNNHPPEWANREITSSIIPALLAGRWDSNNTSDRDILCILGGVKSYDDVLDNINPYLSVEEPPLKRMDNFWSLSSSVDAFQLTAKWFRKKDLRLFKAAFKAVFEKIDPKTEVPPDEWPFFDLEEEKVHSSWLRSGLAETLLLISRQGRAAGVPVDDPEAFAEEVIGQIPNLNYDWKILASLRDQYSTLMEAAPHPLLDSLESLLGAYPQDFLQLFKEGDSIFGGGAMHTGLLWGLETLAWSEEYLERVSMILAKLANLDPGGKIGKRPIGSLRDIFLWWHPGTYASNQIKAETIDKIIFDFPDVGWELISKILPSGHSATSGTSRPEWVIFGDDEELKKHKNSAFAYIETIILHAIELAGHDSERWDSLLYDMPYFPKTHKESCISALSNASKQMAEDEKLPLYEVVRNYIGKNKAYPDAEWSISQEILGQLEGILEILSPNDLVEKHKWLFDAWYPDMAPKDDYEDRKQKTYSSRQTAIEDIYRASGTQGLLRLGLTCQYPRFLAEHLPGLVPEDVIKDLIDLSLREGVAGESFASHLSAQARAELGYKWQEYFHEGAKAKKWNSRQQALLCSFWPNEKSTWELVENLGEEISSIYWEKVPLDFLVEDIEDRSFQIEKMIQARRACEVFYRLSFDPGDTPSAKLLNVFDSTIDEIHAIKTEEEMVRLGIGPYEMRSILDALRSREDVLIEDLYPREYVALPLLGIHADGLAIHDYMTSNPSFFMEVICDLYLPHNQDKSTDEKPDQAEEAKARAAFKLLNGIVTLPGQQDSEIDQDFLFRWIAEVRNLAEKKDRKEVADIHIGHILAHSPEDPKDGAWPHQVVRNALEEFNTPVIMEEIQAERFNMRGSTTRGVFEGGDQERALAKQYADWADVVAAWYHTNKLLTNISESWIRHAEFEDARAEQHKLRR